MGLPPAQKLLRRGMVEFEEEVPPFRVLGLSDPDHHWREAIATNRPAVSLKYFILLFCFKLFRFNVILVLQPIFVVMTILFYLCYNFVSTGKICHKQTFLTNFFFFDNFKQLVGVKKTHANFCECWNK